MNSNAYAHRSIAFISLAKSYSCAIYPKKNEIKKQNEKKIDVVIDINMRGKYLSLFTLPHKPQPMYW